jgi:hypothetical protein
VRGQVVEDHVDLVVLILLHHTVHEVEELQPSAAFVMPSRDLAGCHLRWLARHPNVHFHYTPTHASWLNQIEIWFSILSAKSLKGGSFASVPQLVNHIHSFIDSHNADAKPFVWTKSVVHQKRLKPCFAI